ncbi:hypothetical protein K432DRAFT_444435 [Lepidopterella palustris CBS 459.81]|uniref:Uncharacterized protein n=1 Tax=Lepidopterella palustris CBS 459.81 TaxID=1314670 RepID=A0A8E2JDR6_9PEZI|nr:hypothetical protein K432DRAFT_444435 [Lepidopterella palustris CBS 459.81]
MISKFETYYEYLQALSIGQWGFDGLIRLYWVDNPPESSGSISIVDSTESHINVVTLENVNQLQAALDSRSCDIKTRIIIVAYVAPWRIDGQLVEILGKTFQIPPKIDDASSVAARYRITPETYKWNEPLPSHRISLELRLSAEGCCNTFSALFLPPRKAVIQELGPDDCYDSIQPTEIC